MGQFIRLTMLLLSISIFNNSIQAEELELANCDGWVLVQNTMIDYINTEVQSAARESEAYLTSGRICPVNIISNSQYKMTTYELRNANGDTVPITVDHSGEEEQLIALFDNGDLLTILAGYRSSRHESIVDCHKFYYARYTYMDTGEYSEPFNCVSIK